jgi:hypothetical protein
MKKNKLPIFSITALSLVMQACYSSGYSSESKRPDMVTLEEEIAQIEEENEVEAEQKAFQRFVKLELLNEASPDSVWEQFFRERNAIRIWENFLKKRADISRECSLLFSRTACRNPEEINIELGWQIESIYSRDQENTNQVCQGIIRYVCYHRPTVKRLVLHGDNFRGSELSFLTEIGYLPNLEYLDLSGNQLEKLFKKQEIGALPNLKYLNLTNNQLVELPEEIGNLAQLETLFLMENKLKKFMLTIGSFPQLQNLYLNENQLEEFHIEIGGSWVNLTTLHLSNNRLSKLPVELGELTQLRDLQLRSNPLLELPSSLRNTQTTGIVLRDNQLTVLPASLIRHIETDPVADLQDWDIVPEDYRVDLATVARECYAILPPSLVELCSRQVIKNYKHATSEGRASIIQKLPVELGPSVLSQKLYECPLLQGRRIVYFHSVDFEDEPEASYDIPIFWDRKFYTLQDVKNMLASLEKVGKLYLVPEFYFSQLAAKAQERQEYLAIRMGMKSEYSTYGRWSDIDYTDGYL